MMTMMVIVTMTGSFQSWKKQRDSGSRNVIKIMQKAVGFVGSVTYLHRLLISTGRKDRKGPEKGALQSHNLSSFLWGWERLGRILSPLLWGRDEHRISPLKPFWESFKCVENTSTHSEPTFLEPGCISLLVTTGVYQVRMKMAETRTETWLPFRHKKKYLD